MTTRFMDFRKKEIINGRDGVKVGYVDDIVFDTKSAAVQSIVVYGRLRFFGLFGRGDDLLIPWEDIEMIGEDTILVRTEGVCPAGKPSRWSCFDKLFG